MSTRPTATVTSGALSCTPLRRSPLNASLSRARAGVHPLHIAVKREYTDCIGYLMTRELPIERVKEELGWAVQFDLSQSVFCLLVRPPAPPPRPPLWPTTCLPRSLTDAPRRASRLAPCLAGERRAAWAARALPVDHQLAPAARRQGPLAAARLLLGGARLAHADDPRRARKGDDEAAARRGARPHRRGAAAGGGDDGGGGGGGRRRQCRRRQCGRRRPRRALEAVPRQPAPPRSLLWAVRAARVPALAALDAAAGLVARLLRPLGAHVRGVQGGARDGAAAAPPPVRAQPAGPRGAHGAAHWRGDGARRHAGGAARGGRRGRRRGRGHRRRRPDDGRRVPQHVRALRGARGARGRADAAARQPTRATGAGVA